MKVAATVVLTAITILALFLLLLSAFGISFGVRVGGNLFADAGLSSVNPVYLILLTLAAGGLYLIWQGGRRAG